MNPGRQPTIYFKCEAFGDRFDSDDFCICRIAFEYEVNLFPARIRERPLQRRSIGTVYDFQQSSGHVWLPRKLNGSTSVQLSLLAEVPTRVLPVAG
jgi:hypothetical protein